MTEDHAGPNMTIGGWFDVPNEPIHARFVEEIKRKAHLCSILHLVADFLSPVANSFHDFGIDWLSLKYGVEHCSAVGGFLRQWFAGVHAHNQIVGKSARGVNLRTAGNDAGPSVSELADKIRAMKAANTIKATGWLTGKTSKAALCQTSRHQFEGRSERFAGYHCRKLRPKPFEPIREVDRFIRSWHLATGGIHEFHGVEQEFAIPFGDNREFQHDLVIAGSLDQGRFDGNDFVHRFSRRSELATIGLAFRTGQWDETVRFKLDPGGINNADRVGQFDQPAHAVSP